ncbi:hypothetical protein HAX54_053522 [Datura stramonium]|uniref:Uncharacterized protein n=1 Tax=Datura stramonium TaxID=4076 RepID=A0ABS8WRZ8_DATST|nr:hypothetical protein [Datura stramonium]
MHDVTLVLRDYICEASVTLRVRDAAQKLRMTCARRSLSSATAGARRPSTSVVQPAMHQGVSNGQNSTPTSTRKRNFQSQIKSAKEQEKHKSTTINTLFIFM